MLWEREGGLGQLGQFPAILEEVARSAGPALRAARLVAALRRLWPCSSVYFALFNEGSEQHTLAVDRAGRPLPELAELVSAALAGPCRGAGCLPLPPSADGKLLVAHEIVGDRHWGHFGLALHPGDALAVTVGIQRLLGQLARSLAERLSLAAGQQQVERLSERLARETALADVAEVAGPMAHEFNNFLNALLLQIAALEGLLPEEIRNRLEAIRRQGRTAAALVRSWQRYRQQGRPSVRPLDLAEVIDDVLQDFRAAPETTSDPGELSPLLFVTRLHAGLPSVKACPHDLRRLLKFLLRNAVAALGGAGTISVEAEAADGKVLLRVRDSGPPIPAESLSNLFEPHVPAREGTLPLELAACVSIARRYLGKLRGANMTDGVAVTLELPAARH